MRWVSRGTHVTRECGYRDGCRVRQIVKRLEAAAKTNRPLRKRWQIPRFTLRPQSSDDG